MYLDIGNQNLISKDDIIVVINVSNGYFKDDFDNKINKLVNNEKIVNEDDDITIRSLVMTKKGVYKSNISGDCLINNFMKGLE